MIGLLNQRDGPDSQIKEIWGKCFRKKKKGEEEKEERILLALLPPVLHYGASWL